ncbi:MAG TPA: hypothetical protein ENJ41_02675 [Oceanospirillales bacterium]|nr:hypothetical protein [Oceanospirillales bacterium]
MFEIKACEWFDLSKLGLYLSLVIVIALLMYPLDILIKVLLILSLLIYAYYLLSSLLQYRNASILLNREHEWFIKCGEDLSLVELKDYWLQTKRLYIFLKGKDKSVSIAISRSIIGAQRFSQLRAQLKLEIQHDQ